jgi:hypothetical protein
MNLGFGVVFSSGVSDLRNQRQTYPVARLIA